MRFLIGEFSHESNCFCEHPTMREDFAASALHEGAAVITAHDGKKTVVGGFIDAASAGGHEIVPALATVTFPSGPVAHDFYLWVRDYLVRAAREAGTLDGVLLSLHSGMGLTGDGEEADDPEGDLCAVLTQALGSSIPIAVVMDLHSDTTEKLLANTALSFAYNEEPHRDGYDRGVEATQALVRVCDGTLRPTRTRVRVPMLLTAINMATDEGPMFDLHALRSEMERQPGVIDLSIHAGFYGADQSEAGFSVVATTNDDEEEARALAMELAVDGWQRREDFLLELTSPQAGVARALADGGPIALVDEADDPAGGGACGSVVILRAMLEGGITSGGVSTIHDPEVAALAQAGGIGATLETALGAKADNLHGNPIEISARVAAISLELIPTDPWSGRKVDIGIVAVLDVGGIAVIVTERKFVSENIDLFEILGFDVRVMQAICFKGLTLHVRQALAGKIETFLPIDGIGITHPDVTRLGPYCRLKRPCWPFDDIPKTAWP
ncbi:MAG: M81 family metallopeptidase [Rhodospirillaceae bacterium]|nr:M81 family metallopeptidase [Rhodospirillaceae bacterium]